MKPQSLATLGLRILAIYLVSQSFMFMASMATEVIRSPPDLFHAPILVWAFLWVFSPLIIGLALWFAAHQLARWATRGMGQEPLASMEPRSLATAAFMIAGVLMIVSALPNMVLEIVRIWNAHHPPEAPYDNYVAYLIANLARCLLGTLLILGGSRGFSQLASWLHYAGSSGRVS